jgi:hypothetical protein
VTQFFHRDEPRGYELRELRVEKRCKQIRASSFVERRLSNLEVRDVPSLVGAALTSGDGATLELHRDGVARVLVEEEYVQAVVIGNRSERRKAAIAFLHHRVDQRFSPMTPTWVDVSDI